MQRYLGKISGPLMDRIDLHVEVAPVSFDDLSKARDGEASEHVRARVVEARQRQADRFEANGERAEKGRVHCNAHMGAKQVRCHAPLGEDGQHLMKMAIERLGLSARAYDRILKVARTVADLGGAEAIAPEHLSEAIQYRSLDRGWWHG